MSIAQRLVNLSDGLSAEGILSAAKGGTGTTTGAGSSTPTISAINYGGDDTATNPAGGATITLTGTNFAAGAKVLINTTPVSVVTVVSATQITFTAPALSAGSYILYVVNLDGSTAIAVPGIQYSGTPAWTTAAGSLGTGYETSAVSTAVSAASDSAVTYSVVSGTLPSGVTINSSGTISGTSPLVAGSTTYTFTVRATDLENQDTDRQFSLTVNPDVVTWSSANAIAVQQDAASTTTLVATSAAGQTVSYAVDTLPAGLTLSGATVSGTATVAGTTTTTATATAAVTGKTAQQTITWTVSIAADTYFKYTTLLLNSETSATPFLADASTNNFAVTSFGDTKPSNFNPYTPGYYSNYITTGAYLTTPATVANSGFSTGDFTVEAWIYPTVAQSTTIVSSNYSYSTAAGNWAFYTTVGSANTVYFNAGASSSPNANHASTATATIPLNQWTHIAYSRTSAVGYFFINGVQLGTSVADTSGYAGATGTLYVGRQADGTGYLTGYISNLRIVKGTGVYTASFTPPTSPLTAISGTSLLTCQSNRFIDNSTNAFAVTKAGEAKVSSFDPFVPNSSYSTRGSTYFDGTGDYLRLPTNTALAMGNGDFTIEAYLNLSTVGIYDGVIIELRSSGSTSTGFVFNCRPVTGGYILNLWTDNSANLGSIVMPYNAWNHVALTRTGSTVRLFSNGLVSATFTKANNFSDTPTPEIGYSSLYTDSSLTGYISDLRIVKGTALYTANFTPSTAPLTAVANTQLLTCQTNQPHTNSQFLDNSTSALQITRTGNTTQGSFSPYGANWSNYFDGSGDYLQYQGSATTTLSGDFTLEAWVNVVNFSSARTILCIGDSYAAPGAMFYIDNAAKLGLAVPSRVYTSSGTVPANTWTHIALVRNSGVITGYINGISQGTASNSSTISGTNSYIGQEIYNGGLGGVVMYGYMSNLRLVKGTALYTANFTPSTAPLTPIAGTSLLTCQSSSLVDNSINNFAITRNGDVSVQKFSPFSLVTQTPQTHSVGFDGTGDYLTLPSSSNLVLGSGDFCVEMWYYQQANAFAALFSNAVSSGGGDAQFELQIAASTFYPTVLAWATTFLTSSVASTPNAWNHIAVCRNGTTLSMFLNGTRVATTTTSNNFSSTNAFHISRQAAAAAGYINGYISNLRVVKGSSVYTPSATTIAVPTQPLTAVANTQLLTCQSSTLIDNSVNQFAITAVGDTKPRQQNPFASTTSSAQDYTTSVFGGSAYFDGTGDNLITPNDSALALGSGDFTVEANFYLTTSNTTQCILDFRTAAGSSTGFFLGIVESGKIQVWNGGSAILSNAIVTTGRWYHLALVRKSTTLTAYLDGVAVTNNTSSSTNFTDNRCSIGSSPVDSGVKLIGYLSDIRITKSAVYTSNFVPPTTPLQAVPNTTLLLNMDRAAVADKSGKLNFETWSNAQVSTNKKKYGNASIDLSSGSLVLSSPVYFSGNTDFTVECWFNINSFGANNMLMGWNRGGYDYIDITSTGIGLNQSNTYTASWTFSALSTATWYHLAITRSSGVCRCFINGVKQGSDITNTNDLGGNVATQIGNWYTSPTYPLNGYIDDLRITRGYARYTANFTPPTQALLTK